MQDKCPDGANHSVTFGARPSNSVVIGSGPNHRTIFGTMPKICTDMVQTMVLHLVLDQAIVL